MERLARKAGPSLHRACLTDSTANTIRDLHRFAALVAEECAKVCDAASDSYAVQWDENADRMAQAASEAAQSCAESIRARFKP